MSAVFLTTMGSLYSGRGLNINSVAVGDDGWIYLAGIDYSSSQLPNYKHALTVLGYKDGQLVWKQAFHDRAYGAFEALVFKNGFLYAAGAISTEFNGSDLAVNGGMPVAPPEKAPLDPELVALYSVKDPWMFHDPTYPIFVKLNGETGSIEMAKVLPSPQVQGDDRLRSISVDSEGDIYVGGGGWNPGPDPDDSFNGGEFYWFSRKYSADGNEVWSASGERVALDPNTGDPYITRYQDQIVKVDPQTGNDVEVYSSGLNYVPQAVSHWGRGWVFDADGNIYVLAGRTYWDTTKSEFSDQHGILVKINKVSGNVDWQAPFGLGAIYCLPNYLTFTPSGNLLVSGEVTGSLEGKSGFGKSDGFMLEIDRSSGQILSTQIIGSSKNESISQVQFQPVVDNVSGLVVGHNIIIGGAFEVSRYSLEGRDEKDIYLITDRGFELIGNALNNRIQGGAGNDSILSGAGNDTLMGGSGSDNLSGDSGGDTLIGGDGNDTVKGGDGTDLIVGGDGAGDDSYDGGAGVDTVKYLSAEAAIQIDVSKSIGFARSISLDSKIGNDKLSNIENIIAGNHADVVVGNVAANKIDGENGNDSINALAGNDTIDGGGGNDTLSGGLGVDTFNITAGTDRVMDLGAGGADVLSVSSGATVNATVAATWTATTASSNSGTANLTSAGFAVNLSAVVSGGVGFSITNTGKAASFTGSGFADSLTGGAGNDTLIGGGGMDTLTGGAGNDAMTGGAAGDRFVLLGSDTVVDFNSTDSDTVDITGVAAKAIVTFTTVTGSLDLSGSTTAAAFRATAATSGASIIGGSGADSLIGGIGSDSLSGGLGNDTITAGAGADTITGGRGMDSLTGGAGSDTFVFAAGQTGQATGSDTVSDFAKGAVNTGDRIDYGVDLIIGGSSSTATANEAFINLSTGVATFAAKSGNSLADALADIATRFTAAGDAAGEFALFRVGGKGNHYLFISDGVAGVTANDVVVQLVGLTSISGIDLTNGNLTITG
jgi:Ca2+-binding RTX toxin-like protein